MTFTDEYKGDKAVEAHGNTKLHVIHTNDKKQMAISLAQTNTREQRRVMADAPLYKQRRKYTKELHDIHLHGNHKLHVLCTSNGKDVDKMLSTFRRKLGGMPVKLVGIDVEYTHYMKPQRAAVLQLCIEKECLVYHIAAANDRPMELDKFLMNDEYTFVRFAIEGDKSKLKVSGLEINSDNYIDIQVEWRDPYNKKKFDSLADVAGRMIGITTMT
ncbi:hypothetical protein VPH35_110863 [Triticum aestivum]